MIKRTKVDLSQERRIIIGMIVSTPFLSGIIPIFKVDLLELNYAAIVTKWCIDHYKQYQQAPNMVIQDIFNKWSKTANQPEMVKFIEQFLSTLSDEFTHSDKFNFQYELDQSAKHFKMRSLLILSEDIKYHIENNDIEAAEECRDEYKSIELEDEYTTVDPFTDENAMQAAFEAKQEPLFKLPHKMGELMNGQLTRDGFITLLAPEKRGKSWMLMYIAMQAYRQRCNVAFFSAGDMSQNDMIRRMGIALTGRSDIAKYCKEIYQPVLDCKLNQKNECTNPKRTCKFGCYDGDTKVDYDDPDYEPCCECADDAKSSFEGAVWKVLRRTVRQLAWQDVAKAATEYRRKNRAKGFKMQTYPSDTLTVEMIDAKLSEWERDGWVADVVVVDYFDILDTDIKGGDARWGENKKWKRGRKLSQEKHICLITATQADAASYYIKSLTRANFSEDKRKLAHVTGMYTLNQTVEEKRLGVMRMGTLGAREDAYDESHEIHILQSLEAGQVYLDSY